MWSLAAIFLACESGAANPDVVVVMDTITDTHTPADVSVDAGSDTETAVDTGPPVPVFEIGTNITGANTPDSFTPLVDGDELYVELGFQGLWMVVLAFRTQYIFDDKVTIITRIEVEGAVLGELGLAKQKLHPAGELDYYYNLFLVVTDPTVAGATATISLDVYDEAGARIEEELQVLLTGGSAP